MAASTRKWLLPILAFLLILPAPGTRPGGARRKRPLSLDLARPRRRRRAPPAHGRRAATTGLPIPTDYVIGPDDVLGVVFWRDTDMSGDVTVRPDGNITLPLLRDIKAAGLRPDELREQIQKAASKFIEDPNVTVVVRQINSRNVFITGNVARPGPYPVSGHMTVLQLISVAGGLTEFADAKKIMIMRIEQGKTDRLQVQLQRGVGGQEARTEHRAEAR